MLIDLVKEYERKGYSLENAEARVCQDVILKAIANSPLKEHVTVKGGLIMSNLSKNVRRATQDIDIDFIRYSLSEDSIRSFIQKINILDNLNITVINEIEELKQQDYHGKRVYVQITDNLGHHIESKIDLGVHKHFDIRQEEYCFDICLDDVGASLLINSKEQIFTEKLRSLLKFGPYSRRYKDIFDMYYLKDILNLNELKKCFKTYIFDDINMKENNIDEIVNRIKKTFRNKIYIQSLKTSKRNWIDEDVLKILDALQEYLYSIYK